MPDITIRHFVFVLAVGLLAFGVNFHNRRQETSRSSTKEDDTASTTTISTPSSTQPPAFFNREWERRVLSDLLSKRTMVNYDFLWITCLVLAVGLLAFGVNFYKRRQTASTISTPSTAFFNREEEKRILSNLLNAKTKSVTILMGPPSVGKTALVREVLKGFPNSSYVDLRGLDRASAADSLFSLFRQSKKSWVSRMAKNVSSGNFRLLLGFVEGTLNFAPASETSFRDWMKLFLEELNKCGKEKPAVLVIDEANCLKDLYMTDDVFLSNLLTLLVQVSKQDNQVSVILATSDSFFMEWLQQVGVAKHMTTMTLGDLPKEDARKFFDAYKETKKHSNISFDDVFGALGGRMISIQDFLIQPQPFADLPRVSAFLSRLGDHCNPSSASSKTVGIDSGKPRWTEKEFVDVVRALVNSPVHAVFKFAPELSSVSAESLSDLVRFDILCYRPDSRLARDFLGVSSPMYTFLFPVDVIAAQKFLHWHDEKQKSV